MIEFTDKKLQNIPEYKKSFSITLNPHDMGGEFVSLILDVYDNGDTINNIFTNMHIQSHCYGIHSSKLSLYTVNPQFMVDALQKMIEEINKIKR